MNSLNVDYQKFAMHDWHKTPPQLEDQDPNEPKGESIGQLEKKPYNGPGVRGAYWIFKIQHQAEGNHWRKWDFSGNEDGKEKEAHSHSLTNWLTHSASQSRLG